MPTIQDQLQLEKDMVGQGIAKYLESTRHAENKGRARDTSYARTMIREMLLPVAEYISDAINKTGPGRKAKFVSLLKGSEPDVIAYITLTALFDQLMSERRDGDINLITLSRVIGDRIHDEIRFTAFRDENQDYFDSIIEDFKRRGTTEYRHMHRVLTKKANDLQNQWTPWTENEQVHVGMFCIEAVETTTDMIERERITQRMKTRNVVRASTELVQWINDHMDFMKMLHPSTGPCIIKPDDWTDFDSGGFYSPQLRKRNTLVKTRFKPAVDLLKSARLERVLKAVNAIQGTAWRVNRAVLEDMKTVWEQNLRIGMPPTQPIEPPLCPIPKDLKKEDFTDDQKADFEEWRAHARAAYTEEHQRRSKCLQLSRVLSMAGTYSTFDSIWFVYTCDFRGRLYATSSSFHPQGADFAKGLLEFADGKQLGKEGFYWLKVHGANKYGYDKDTYDGRVSWIEERHDDLRKVSMDPVRHRDLWEGADKPYQFLAFCHEYRKATDLSDPTLFVSHLPVALDGSCNGLQNFSAMLRDSVGGKATNLTACEKPADIYGAVSTVLISKLERDTSDIAKEWLSYGIDRSLTKKPVMTLPYGSTRRTCTQSILSHIRDKNPEHFGKRAWASAQYLTPLLWDSIGEVVIAARAAMDWLQKVSRIVSKKNAPIIWETPLGFPVYQCIYKQERHELRTRLLGGLKYSLSEPTEDVDSRKQASGISPNFVHSMDATHMMVVAARNNDKSLAMIHDDFGTHASDIPEFIKSIRQSFVDLYTLDRLNSFKCQLEFNTDTVLPHIPSKGDLDINEVLDAEYFFG